jgi:hypothetical protein
MDAQVQVLIGNPIHVIRKLDIVEVVREVFFLIAKLLE